MRRKYDQTWKINFFLEISAFMNPKYKQKRRISNQRKAPIKEKPKNAQAILVL